MKSNRTTFWGAPLVSMVILFCLFAAYLQIAVPIIEGQSGARIPQIDLLGAMKSELPGQWISLFADDSWQRDTQNRNIIHADQNILLFQDYQSQEDGSLRVSKLCLLIFDKQSQTNGSADLETTTSLPDLDGRRFPTVIEAYEDAILTFEKSRPLAMGKYGELQSIQFTGKVQFWKEDRDPSKAFFLETFKLMVAGDLATTTEDVRFRFGDSIGQATGLNLVFTNPDSQQSLHPSLTKIEGIQTMRFGNIRHLSMQVPKKETDLASGGSNLEFPTGQRTEMSNQQIRQSQTVELSCAGKAEFFLADLYANFHDQVVVKDIDSGYRMDCELMQVVFASDANSAVSSVNQPANNSSTAKTTPKVAFVPAGLTPLRIVAQGIPASVVNTSDRIELQSAQLEYDLVQQEFVGNGFHPNNAGSFAVRHPERAPRLVTLITPELRVSVPYLRYRPAKTPENSGKSGEWVQGSKDKLGAVWANGAGTLQYSTGAGKAPVDLSWSQQLTLADDAELTDRKVVSVYGDASLTVDIDTRLHAQAIHFWLKESASYDPVKMKMQTRFQPDLLLAEKNVRFFGQQIQGDVQHASVYFPEEPVGNPTTVSQSSVPRNGQKSTFPINFLQGGRVLQRTAKVQASAMNSNDFVDTLDSSSAANRKDRGMKFVGQTLVVSLKQRTAALEVNGVNSIVQPPVGDLVDQRESSLGTGRQAGRYQVQQIELMGGVEIVEVDFSSGTAVALPDAGYSLKGATVTGIARSDKELDWTISGGESVDAVAETSRGTIASSTLHFDQQANRIWSDKAGSLSFPVGGIGLSKGLVNGLNSSEQRLNPQTGFVGETVSNVSGKGSVRWNGGMEFDGRIFDLKKQVQCDLEQLTPENHVQRIQSFCDGLRLELTVAIDLDGKRKSGHAPKVKQMVMSSPAGVDPTDPRNIVRLYQQEFNADQQTISQEVIWAPSVVFNQIDQNLQIQGPGKLWSVRLSKKQNPAEVTQVNWLPGDKEMDYIKVEFQSQLDGRIDSGKFVFTGPVSTLYGTVTDWQIQDSEDRLLDPVRLTCDTMTLNRWKASPGAEMETELDASGSVHVIGQQFEALASRLKYTQSQDLLTVQGDSRMPAKFWQNNLATGGRNHMFAQKIWYRPKNRWFNFEGFKEGDLTFFAGQSR